MMGLLGLSRKKKKPNDRVDHSGARHYKQILQNLQGLL